MAFDANGVFQRLHNWSSDRDNSVKILADRVDNEADGIVQGINDLVSGTARFTGPIKAVDGTSALPALTFHQHNTSGFFYKSSTALGVSLGGLEIGEISQKTIGNRFDSVADLLASTASISEGAFVPVENAEYKFKVAPAAATDHDLTTAGGVKLYRLKTVAERKNPAVAGFKAILDATAPTQSLPDKVMLQKLRSDFYEWCAYTPMTTNGTDWHRWYHTNRIGNSTSSGAPRLLLGSLASLYSSTTIAKPSENYTTGTEGQATTGTQAVTDGTQTGTWTSSATVDSVTGISYSTTVGDTVVYTVTGAERIAWRAYKNSGNGGWAEVTIEASSVEIGASLYDVPADSGTSRRTVKLNTTSLSNGMVYVPLASGLDSSTTYTVTIEVDASNPASGRCYDGGLREYDDIAFDSDGLHGTVQEKTLSGNVGNLMFYSGQTVVYELTNATRVDWKYISTTGSNTAEFTIYTSAGVEIASGDYTITSLATAQAQGLYQSEIASGLTKGTYYLHVRAASTVTGTDQRIYDAGAVGTDADTAGTVGTDAFDLRGQNQILGAATTWGQSNIFAFGNQEYATQFTKTDTAATSDDFVGGVHNNDTSPSSIVVEVDGVVVDYTAAADLTEWTGSAIRIKFTTTNLFDSDQSEIGTLDWVIDYSASGYTVSITDTITATTGAYSHVAYAGMLVSPNGDTSVAQSSQGQLAADIGNFDSLAHDGFGSKTPVAYDGTSTTIDERCASLFRYNDNWVASCHVLNAAEIENVFRVESDALDAWGSYNDRTDGTGKSYARAYPGAGPVLRADGHAVKYRKTYRAYKTKGAKALLGE